MANTQKPRRSFGVDTTNFPTETPLLEDGVYAGNIINASIFSKDNEPRIAVVKETVWNKKEKAFKETGVWHIEGNLYFGVALISKLAIKTLHQDEPKVFGGRIRLAFDKETFNLIENPVLGAFLSALGVKDIDFREGIDWEFNENIEVPEDLANVPDIVDMLNSVKYYLAFFNNICDAVNGLPVLVKVIKQKNSKTPEIMQNTIDGGNYNDFCGILPYVEGAEDDLEG